GVFGPGSARFSDGPWLCAPRADCPALNLHGPAAQMTVVAWIKRDPTPPDLAWSCQAVAGMWNEHGRRQYCLFLNLRIWESAEQVGAHISRTGGPTPGYKYCMDAALGATPVPFSTWQCVAVTYDGAQARAYLGGVLDAREGRNPFAYPGGLHDGGPHGADFTVGAVSRPETVTEDFREIGHVVANRYRGLLGGLAVYNRALAAPELLALAALIPPAAA
ncbi:MAG: LamG domain-containing protein, partial [Burkholderiales bacterium]|nr:LamG domain-containing protein [Opitutaceae bacterium]